jgi:hypothetical protein
MAKSLGVPGSLDGSQWFAQNNLYMTFGTYPIGTQVSDPEKDKDRASWVNFKRVVWHDSFYELLKTIKEYSSSGCWITCSDGVDRHIYPLIMILSADYEEQ